MAKKRVSKTTARKAPTRSSRSEPAPPSRRGWIPIVIALVVFLAVVGVSAAIGYSDGGEIDVNDTISERRNAATPEERKILDSVPTQQSRNLPPGGGLVPTTDIDPDLPPPTPPETGSSTASSTDEVATSTEEIVDESADGEAGNEDAAAEQVEEVVAEEATDVVPEETESEPPVETSEGG